MKKILLKKAPEMHGDFSLLRVDPVLVCGSVSRLHLTEALGQQEVTNVFECPAVIKPYVNSEDCQRHLQNDFSKYKKIEKEECQ